MLPYSNSGGYGYVGRRKGLFGFQNTITVLLAVLLLGALGFAFYTHFHATAAHKARTALQRDLESTRSELYSVKSQYSSRNAELEHLQMTHGHTQRRLTELTSQLQRKEAELVAREQALQQQIKERSVVEQHRGAREAELSKMVDELRQELVRTDGVIEALDKKVAHMEVMHSNREKDWHKLAATWVKYEQDLHQQYKTCTDEVSKLRNLTMAMNDTGPLPEAEPKIRPETDFGNVGVNVPEHHAHKFDPLAPPTPPAGPASSGAADLPLPEAKIRESIVQMTGGKVGTENGSSSSSPSPSPGSPQQAEAPTPVSSHHGDIYHQDFHQEDDVNNHPYHGQYDQYHGHYDSYDPMDQYWLRDSHGDWNADEEHLHHHEGEDFDPNNHEHHEGGGGDPHDHYFDHHVHVDSQQHHDIHDQHQHQQHQQQYQQHEHGHSGKEWHPPQHPGDHHQGHQQQPQQQHGSAPQWQQPDEAHQHYQQHMKQQEHYHKYHREQIEAQERLWQQQHQQAQQQQHQQQQAQQQQAQQQQHGGHGGEHHHHPTGDLAYKMGW